MSKQKWALATSMLLLLTGGIIYLLFRPRRLLMFSVADAMGCGEAIDRARTAVADVTLPRFVTDNLPGGLWSAAYVLLMHGLFCHQPLRRRLAWAAVVPVVGGLSELLQWLRWVPGTFDVTDMLCYVLPYIIYYISQTRKL